MGYRISNIVVVPGVANVARAERVPTQPAPAAPALAKVYAYSAAARAPNHGSRGDELTRRALSLNRKSCAEMATDIYIYIYTNKFFN